MPINLEEIFKELESDPQAVNLCLAADKIKASRAAKEKCIAIFEYFAAKDPILSAVILACDKPLVNCTQAVAALMFEVGRLYGRQEIVNETLEEIK